MRGFWKFNVFFENAFFWKATEKPACPFSSKITGWNSSIKHSIDSLIFTEANSMLFVLVSLFKSKRERPRMPNCGKVGDFSGLLDSTSFEISSIAVSIDSFPLLGNLCVNNCLSCAPGIGTLIGENFWKKQTIFLSFFILLIT